MAIRQVPLKGADGRPPEFRLSGDTLEYRLIGDVAWQSLGTVKGTPGNPGVSAYQVWLNNGNSGTEAQFLASLKGQAGAAGSTGAAGVGVTSAAINGSGHLIVSLTDGQNLDVGLVKGADGSPGAVGPKGDKGDSGSVGAAGKSAYQAWLDAGNSGTQADFLASLKGAKGDKGDKGDVGPASTVPGPKGDKGDPGATGATGPASTVPGPTGPQGPKGDPGDSGSGSPLTIREVGGSPSLTPTVLEVPNGALEDRGGGVARLSVGGAAEGAPLPNVLSGLGDSILAGLWAGGGSSANSYIAKLGTMLGWTTYNRGISGSTVASGTGSSDPMVARTAAVVADNPGRIIFAGGTNDFNMNIPLGQLGSSDPTTFYGAYLASCQALLDGSGAALYCMTPLTRDPTNGAISEFDSQGFSNNLNSAGASLEQYRQAIRDVVAWLQNHGRRGRVFLIDAGRDLYPWFRPQRSTYMDAGSGYHPIDVGHALIARYLSARLDPDQRAVTSAPTPPVTAPTPLHAWDMVQGANANTIYDAASTGTTNLTGSGWTWNSRGAVFAGAGCATGNLPSAASGDVTLTVAGQWAGTGADGQVALNLGTNSDQRHIMALGNNTAATSHAYCAYTNSSDDLKVGSMPANTPFVLTARYIASTGALSLFLNGAPLGSTTVTSGGLVLDGLVNVGAFQNAGLLPWSGEIHYVRMDGPTSNAEVAAIYGAIKATLTGRGITLP